MIKPETKAILETINASPYGRAIQDFLDEKFEVLNDVQTCKSWEETLGRKYALGILEELFSFMKDVKIEVKSKNIYT